MADKKGVILRSNYTLRNKHKLLSNGSDIYERDYMTTTNLGGWDSGSIPYGESNFKIVSPNLSNATRKKIFGSWLKQNTCVNQETNYGDIWTLTCLDKNKKINDLSDESKIVFSKQNNTLLDYCYFGSCQKLIESSIKNIVSFYPAELYVTDSNYQYFNESIGDYEILGSNIFENPVVIYNPFEIDLSSKIVDKKIKASLNYNPLRYFCESRNKYKILDNNNEALGCVFKYDVDKKDKNCYKDGERVAKIVLFEDEEDVFVIYEYYVDETYVYITDGKWIDYKIRPIDAVVTEYFNNISDFEKLLLTKDSNPIFSFLMKVRYMTDYGLYEKKERFTLPSYKNWNVAIDNIEFTTYVNKLMDIATFYDEYFTNNMWRMMVHDSIKNLDSSFRNDSRDEDIDDYNFGISRVEGLFGAIARQYDDIKLHIDNIKKMNNVSYNLTNNMPNYFLSDELNNKGWDVVIPSLTLDENTVINDVFDGVTKEYDLSDVNTTFYTELLLNSKELWKHKGTRHGIEMLLSLFGLCSYDYAKNLYNFDVNNIISGKTFDDLSERKQNELYDYHLDEYVVVASHTSGDVYTNVEKMPVEIYNGYIDSLDYTTNLSKLPVREVDFITIDKNGDETIKKYIIPWFDKNEDTYGNMYFQMYGGWGKTYFKEINDSFTNQKKIIYETDNVKLYDETLRYLKVVNNISELMDVDKSLYKNNDIVYVNNLDDFSLYFPNDDVNDASNYFIIKDIDNIRTIGNNGWTFIAIDNITKNISDEGLRVLYLDSIVDEFKGNNPHAGYERYDDGNMYIEYFRQLFKYPIENNMFGDEAYDCYTGEIKGEIRNCGFTLSDLVKDNSKVWFFTNNNNEQRKTLRENSEWSYEFDNTDTINVGKLSYENKETKFDTELQAFNFETFAEGDNDEAAANSIINVKKLKLQFNKKYSNLYNFREYLFKVIMVYVKQMIPSTTILEVSIDGMYNDGTETCFKFPEIVGITEKEN